MNEQEIVPHSEIHPAEKREAGTPVTRSVPRPAHIPGVELSPEASRELAAELADIRRAEMHAGGPGVIGGRPPEVA